MTTLADSAFLSLRHGNSTSIVPRVIDGVFSSFYSTGSNNSSTTYILPPSLAEETEIQKAARLGEVEALSTSDELDLADFHVMRGVSRSGDDESEEEGLE